MSIYKALREKLEQSKKRLKGEKRGIYNVSFNEKDSTLINADLEMIENAIIDYVKDYSFYYVKGYHNFDRNKGLGANHIKLHLEKGSEGEISIEELLNLGNSIREYLKVFKEPFIDTKGAKIYEWENDKGVRFRAITDKIGENHLENITKDYQEGGPQLPLSPLDSQIITFYSDRNINAKMEFKNPKVKANDESILRYGSREYEVDGKNANRLLTNYSETEYGERQGRGEQGQLRQEFNDRDFLHPVNKETIPNPSLESQIQSEEEKLFDEMLKTQEKINDMPRIKDFKEAFEKDLEKSFNVETSEENLQKDTKEKTNPKLRQKR